MKGTMKTFWQYSEGASLHEDVNTKRVPLMIS